MYYTVYTDSIWIYLILQQNNLQLLTEILIGFYLGDIIRGHKGIILKKSYDKKYLVTIVAF